MVISTIEENEARKGNEGFHMGSGDCHFEYGDRESLTKMSFEQTHKGDVDEPWGCLRQTLQTERTACAKALGQKQTTHLCGSY